MKAPARFAIALVTAPNLKTARSLARAAVSHRLAACANIVPRIESHYRWQGKLERSAESLIVFKTARARLRGLEALILSLHPYDTPEFVTIELASGNTRYLAWLAANVEPGEKT